MSVRVDAARYVDPDFAARETRLWERVWLPVAHRDEGSVTRRIAGVTLRAGVDGASAEGRALHHALWAGFVWVHLAADPPPLTEHLAPVDALLGAYGIDGWILEGAVRCRLACNWKTSVDVHNESYHVPVVHPEVLAIVDEASEAIDLLGDHSRIRVPMGRPSARLGAAPLGEPLLAALRAEGIAPEPFERAPQEARRALQRARRGRAPDALTDDQLTDDHQFFVFPNLQLNVFFDHALVFRHWPDGPERCFFEQLVIRPPRPGETPRPVRCREVEPDDPAFGPVTGADLALVPRLQRGLASSGIRALVLGEREKAIAHFHATLERWLA